VSKSSLQLVTAIEDQHLKNTGASISTYVQRRFPQRYQAPHHRRRQHHHDATGGNLFLDRSDRSVRRKMQEILLALQIERRYTKPQIFTMYANQVYLAHGIMASRGLAILFRQARHRLKLQEPRSSPAW